MMTLAVALLFTSWNADAQRRVPPEIDDMDDWARKSGAYSVMKCDSCGAPRYRKDGIVQDVIVCNGKDYKAEGKAFFFHNKACQLAYEKEFCKGK